MGPHAANFRRFSANCVSATFVAGRDRGDHVRRISTGTRVRCLTLHRSIMVVGRAVAMGERPPSERERGRRLNNVNTHRVVRVAVASPKVTR